MNRQPLDALIANLRSLPPFPAGATRLMGLNPTDPAYFEEASGIIRADPALSTQVIRIANSALYTGQSEVEELDRAIMRVGVRMIVASLGSSHLRTCFDVGQALVNAVWLDIMQSALVCKCIAEATEWPDLLPETAYTHGLLHDMGRLALVALFPDGLERIVDRRPSPGNDLCAREKAILGMPHDLAGRLLANLWGFPPKVAQVVAGHHMTPNMRFTWSPELNRIVNLVIVADEVVHALGPHSAPLTDERKVRVTLALNKEGPVLDCLNGLDLTPEDIMTVLPKAQEEYLSQRTLLGMAPRQPVDLSS